MRDLFVTPQFERDIRKIPHKIRIRAEIMVMALRSNPFDTTLSIRKIKEVQQAVWRVRIGAYRLLYTFTQTTLTLHRFRHRKDIYRTL